MKSRILILTIIFLTSACAHKNIPPLTLLGEWHTVNSGDTADSVAKKYNVHADILVELNDIPPTGTIQNRDKIFIPKKHGTPPGTGKKPPAVKSAVTVSSGTIIQGYCGTEGRPCFAWPIKGEFSKKFGPDGDNHNDGIDITAPEGTPVTAAEKGVVIYSGNAIKGYGNLILIKHSNGIISVYAHSSKNIVKEGQQVKRGQKIAKAGKTGAASQPGLHFEIRVNEQPRDPMGYLPAIKITNKE
jgi:murein DD-endopeptidase MepM/ murein hydrolase activator NlpD